MTSLRSSSGSRSQVEHLDGLGQDMARNVELRKPWLEQSCLTVVAVSDTPQVLGFSGWSTPDLEGGRSTLELFDQAKTS